MINIEPKTRVTRLKEFMEGRVCPKCGAGDVTVEHRPVKSRSRSHREEFTQTGEMVTWCGEVTVEHMLEICQRCRYEHYSLPIDSIIEPDKIEPAP